VSRIIYDSQLKGTSPFGIEHYSVPSSPTAVLVPRHDPSKSHRSVSIGYSCSLYLLLLLIFLLIRLWYLGFSPESDIVGWRVKQFQAFLETGVTCIWLRLYGLSRGKRISISSLGPGRHTQIRLLKLLLGSMRDSIECVTFQVSLDANGLQYEAFSYTWGRLIPIKSVRIDGEAFSVTTNLEGAIRHLRRVDEPRILWADAICINQLDTIKEANKSVL
jgi:hypothetical protein